MDQPTPSAASKTKIYLIAGLVVVCSGVAVYLLSSPAPQDQNQEATNVATQQELQPTRPIPAAPPAAVAAYKKGTYTADGTYQSPAGLDVMGVSITLDESGVITDTAIQVKAENPFSQKWQGTFAENYKQYVVGKKIGDVSMSKISGSSLTPKGFNEALEKIKKQAQS